MDFDLFYFDFKRAGQPPAPGHCRLRPYRLMPGALVQQSWKRLGWPRFDSLTDKADLYHFTNFIIPPLSSASKALVSIHDISFILHPEFAEKRNLEYLTARIRKTASRAQGIITISRQSAMDIQKHLGVSEDAVFPIHLGVSEMFRHSGSASIAAARSALGVQRPYILMVGTFEPRKNIPFAVSLIEQMSFFDGDLVIVGQKGWKNEPVFEAIGRSIAAGRIRTFTSLPDAQLVALYSGAEFLLMTSFYEGFGFPPLEAMACGTPVLTSSGGSLAEVCGDAAVVVDSFAPELWLEKADLILHDSELRNRLKSAGPAHAGKYTWQSTAEKHIEAYRKVLQ
jgi:glycosyltransferase involved in cell wall biosynthesis